MKARLRTALLGDTRRWAVLSLVLLLHVLLWQGLERLMQQQAVPVSGSSDAIRVEFVAAIQSPAPPPTAISPIRDSVHPPAAPATGASAPKAQVASPPQAQQPVAAEPAPRPRLFRPDGSPNVAEDLWADIERHTLADGSSEYRIADLDKAGHFDARPTMDYQASAFERYWVPNESLLEEWVRRGIKTVSIPIPGTNQRITCFISFVAPGAACGITHPRQMNERVETEYVPPPNRNLRTK